MEVNWARLVLSEQFYTNLQHRVSQHIFNPEDAEEGVLYVLEKLAENDWARCRKYSGQSKPETFLHSVVARLIIDFHRKTYGRKRPPEWLKRKGQLWVQIWERVCLKRQSAEALVTELCRNGDMEPEPVLLSIRTIKAKLPWCGVSDQPVELDGDQESGDDSLSPEIQLEKQLFADLLEISQAVLQGKDPSQLLLKVGTLGPQGLANGVNQLSFAPDDLLMVKMYFEEGLSFAAIGKIHNNVKPAAVRQKVVTVIETLRQFLASQGIDQTAIQSIMGER